MHPEIIIPDPRGGHVVKPGPQQVQVTQREENAKLPPGDHSMIHDPGWRTRFFSIQGIRDAGTFKRFDGTAVFWLFIGLLYLVAQVWWIVTYFAL